MALEPDLEYLDAEPEARFPPPPVQTAVQLLPFDQLTWENFERFCYRLARTESECEEGRLFGERGQDQSGIDLYCRDKHGYSVYQCRRIATLTAGGLARAVDGFLNSNWADNAHRFVFCTSLRAVRVELAEEIKAQTSRLQARDPKVTFDVWDAEELSARLKEGQSMLVGDFFGPAWRDAFLPGAAVGEVSTQLAEMTMGLQRLEQNWLRIRFIGWAPTLLREAIEELGREDPPTYAKLDDAIDDPPDRARVIAIVMHPPQWLLQAGARPWRILGMLAERHGEWDAARRAWLAVADQSEGDARAGFLVAASVAADLGGDAAGSAELLEAAEALSPVHPRVVLQRLDQRSFGPERLRALEGIQSDDPAVAVLLAVHRATASMLVSDMDEAGRYVAEAERLMPDSLAVQATAVNAAIHRGRIASNEHKTVDYPALMRANEGALQIRKDLAEARRYEESLRLLMLAVDALTVGRETNRARALVRLATEEELATEDAAEILGDAALRAGDWGKVLSLTEHAHATGGIRRIRASAHLQEGGLYEQNRALATLDELIAERGREASQAALFRLAATLGQRRADWSEDAFGALREEGFEAAALSAKAQFLALRQRDYASADALLAPYEGTPWADDARLRIAVRRGDNQTIRSLADAFLARGAVQEDLVQCAIALAVVGEVERARDILIITTLDAVTPPATRADAYSALVSLLAERVGDWDEAARLHRKWLELRPGDDRASAWAPRIANRTRVKP